MPISNLYKALNIFKMKLKKNYKHRHTYCLISIHTQNPPSLYYWRYVRDFLVCFYGIIDTKRVIPTASNL